MISHSQIHIILKPIIFFITYSYIVSYWIRDGSSLDSTRLARLDTIAKQGPGSTRPAQKPEMLILNWLDASLF